MATYTQLQDRVLAIVIDTPSAVQDQVPTIINEAIRTLQREHNFKVGEATGGPYPTTVATRLLTAIPSNHLRWRKKPYLIEQHGKTRDLQWAQDRQSAEREYGTAAGGEATTANISGLPQALLHAEDSDESGTGSVEVYPLPDGDSLYADGEYQIMIPYQKYLADLSAGSDTNWFTVNAVEYIVFMAAAGAFFVDWDEERATLWTQRAMSKLREVIKADKMLRISSVSELVPQPDARGSRVRGRDRGLA